MSDNTVLWVDLTRRIDREYLSNYPQLRYIVSPTTGLDHIDHAYCREHNIEVLSLQGETEFLRSVRATAEHTWGLLLALTRRIPWAFEHVKMGFWDRGEFIGHDLSGRTLGIIGMGRIGQMVARYAVIFGMKVDPYDNWRQYIHDLEMVIRRSDVITLHVPLTNESRGMIGERQLSWMRPGALLINTSRGAIIDEDALLAHLESGHLGGAALDVLCDEPTPAQVGLVQYARTHDNLIITPHIGGATVESMAMTRAFMQRKLEARIERDKAV